MKDKHRKKLYYIALFAGIGALITNIFELDFKNFETRPIINIALWIIYILAMIISITDSKKELINNKNIIEKKRIES